MAKRMQQAVEQATIDAQTEAISKGLSGSQAQVCQHLTSPCMMHGIEKGWGSELAEQ
jgi:hypothetical protein